MTDNPGFEHLSFRYIRSDKPCLKGGGGGDNQTTKNNKNNCREHGTKLKGQASELSRFWHNRRQERTQQQRPEITCGVPFLLEIDPDAELNFLRGLGLEIVCELEKGFILVASEDVDLTVLNEKLDGFIADQRNYGSPAKVYGLQAEPERIKNILSENLQRNWEAVVASERITVSISIECKGVGGEPNLPKRNDNQTQEDYEQECEKKKCEYLQRVEKLMMQREAQFEHIASAYHAEIGSYIDQHDSFTVSLCVSGEGLRDIVENYPYVFEVREPENIIMEGAESADVSMHDTVQILPPTADSPIICVIDSGIQEGHRYLQPAVRSEESICLVPDEDSVNDCYGRYSGTGGHGTRVAGAILYPTEIPEDGQVTLPFYLRNARVLDYKNRLPLGAEPELMLEKLVRRFAVEAEQKTKLFNHSIGECVPFDREKFVHMSSWATMMDALSYDFDILFIQAAGNISSEVISAMSTVMGKNYPDYFSEEPTRISDPAENLQALTVGSLSLADYEDEDSKALGGRGDISGFSRIGPGIWDSIKPDVVEYGGTYIMNKATGHLSVNEAVCPDLLRTSPEGPAHARDDIGTSFSTPKVTYIAGEIQRILPDAPALLYRALIAQSANYPEGKDIYAMTEEESNMLVRQMGYGVPDVERATSNNESRITFITPDAIEIAEKEAHAYSITIPEELRQIGDNYKIKVEITLAYVAKPRRTRRRVKRYMSTWVEWKASRIGESEDRFIRRLYETGKNDEEDEGGFKWMFHDQRRRGTIKNLYRSNQTLQKDWCILESNQLGDHFCIAVIGHKGWGSLFKARYVLTVSFEAIHQDVPIYEPIRLANQVRIEVPVAEVPSGL